MTEGNVGFSGILRKFKDRVGDYFEDVSQMSLDERISELSELHKTKGNLEEELGDTRMKILFIENMQDVAEQKVSGDNVAVGLLNNLREKGDISYRDLTKEGDELFRQVTYHYLKLLKTAGLVEWEPDPSFEGDYFIKLTERGRSADYSISLEIS